MSRESFVSAIREQIGRPYRWAHQSPATGFDCSGLVVWALQRAEDPSTPDMSAAALYDFYHSQKKLLPLAKPGDLMFYGKSESSISHVMVVLDVWGRDRDTVMGTVVGARGGGSETTSIGAAWAGKAFVDVVPFDYWLPSFRGIRDPWWGVE